MMRWFIILLLLGSLACAKNFSAANEAYASGDFARAKSEYQKAASAAPSAAVFYNLGNACFRLNEFGNAALAYERALMLQPNYPEASANLKLVRDRTSARMEPPPWIESLQQIIPLRAAIWLGIGLTWASTLFLGWMLWVRAGIGAAICGVFLVVATGTGTFALLQAATRQQHMAIVLNEKAVAHADPSERASTVDTLAAGSRVYIEGAQGAWSYCKLPNGGFGWIRSGEIERAVLVPDVS